MPQVSGLAFFQFKSYHLKYINELFLLVKADTMLQETIEYKFGNRIIVCFPTEFIFPQFPTNRLIFKPPQLAFQRMTVTTECLQHAVSTTNCGSLYSLSLFDREGIEIKVVDIRNRNQSHGFTG